MNPKVLPVLLVLLVAHPVEARQLPPLTPDGWREVTASSETRTRTFVSPDGSARLSANQLKADPSDLDGDMDSIAYRDGERITYEKRGRSWIAVSGYRGDEIFYRKSNLACGGSRWNNVELQYPREDKRQLDGVVTTIARRMTLYYNDCQPVRR